MSSKTFIWVKTQFHGVHCYPEAPSEVDYLRSVHRHLFKVKATVQVHHDDREVEFHMMQNFIDSLYTEKNLDVNRKSCEMLAKELLDTLISKYGNKRDYRVEVSEDGECGAFIELLN